MKEKMPNLFNLPPTEEQTINITETSTWEEPQWDTPPDESYDTMADGDNEEGIPQLEFDEPVETLSTGKLIDSCWRMMTAQEKEGYLANRDADLEKYGPRPEGLPTHLLWPPPELPARALFGMGSFKKKVPQEL